MAARQNQVYCHAAALKSCAVIVKKNAYGKTISSGEVVIPPVNSRSVVVVQQCLHKLDKDLLQLWTMVTRYNQKTLRYNFLNDAGERVVQDFDHSQRTEAWYHNHNRLLIQ